MASSKRCVDTLAVCECKTCWRCGFGKSECKCRTKTCFDCGEERDECDCKDHSLEEAIVNEICAPACVFGACIIGSFMREYEVRRTNNLKSEWDPSRSDVNILFVDCNNCEIVRQKLVELCHLEVSDNSAYSKVIGGVTVTITIDFKTIQEVHVDTDVSMLVCKYTVEQPSLAHIFPNFEVLVPEGESSQCVDDLIERTISKKCYLSEQTMKSFSEGIIPLSTIDTAGNVLKKYLFRDWVVVIPDTGVPIARIFDVEVAKKAYDLDINAVSLLLMGDIVGVRRVLNRIRDIGRLSMVGTINGSSRD